MPIKRNLFLLCWIAFFNSLIPAYVIERLFWQARGMSVGMVVACEAVYAITVIALEVPSGVWADRLGRKKLLVAAAVTGLVEFALLLGAHAFWQFALAVLISGIGKAAASGAENALLYDTLAAMGRADRFERLMGRVRALDGVGAMLAALSGSLLAERYGFVFPYQLSLASCALALGGTLLLREPPGRFAKEARASARSILRQAAAFFRRQPDALVIILQATLVAAFIIYVDEFWQLYLMETGFPVALFGVVSVLFSGASIAGDLLAGRVARRGREARRMVLLSGVVALSLCAAGIVRSRWGIGAMLVGACASEMMHILAVGYLHRRADDASRATIESVGSLLERVAVIPLGIVFAWIADTQSLFSAYTVLSIGCGVATLVFWRFCRA